MPTTAAPMERQRKARDLVTSLVANKDKVREKDWEFIKSLSEQEARFTEKQLDYIVGNDEGQTPKNFPSLYKRYATEGNIKVGAAKKRGVTEERRKEIDAMTADELENELDKRYEEYDGDMARFEADDDALYMRKVWEQAQ